MGDPGEDGGRSRAIHERRMHWFPLDRHGGRLAVAHLRHGLQTIMETKRLIERNANIDLALECMWMTILGK